MAAQDHQAPKVVQDLQSCVKELKNEFDENRYPITDDSVTLQKFCSRLEYLMQGEFKIRYSLMGSKKEYWDYYVECLSKTKGLNDGIKFVKAMSEVRTSLGRGRAFIRYCLVHQRLADTLQQCLSKRKVTSDWYSPKSLLMNPKLSSLLINDFYDLNEVQFDLSPTGNDLDAAWPTFARKTFSHGSQMWQLPSRTTSMNSLSSQATSEIMSTSVPEDSSKADYYSQLHKDFQECEEINRQLRQQILSMETENEDLHKLALETEERLSRFQEDAERFKQDTLYKLEKSEMECQKKGEQMNQINLEFQTRLKEAEQIKTDLCDRIECLNKQHESREKYFSKSEVEFQSQIAEQDVLIGSLRLQVTSLTQDQESLNTLVSKKNENITDLESKLANFEVKNIGLLSKMEGMVEEKNVTVSSHFDSATKVHELLSRVNDVETENLNLKGTKEELSRKVELLEQRLSEESASVSNLKAKNSDLEYNCRRQIEKVEILENSKKELEMKLEETKSSLSMKETTMCSLSEDLKNVKQEKKTLSTERCELKASKEDLASKVIQTEIQVKELKEQLLNLKTIFSQIDSNVEDGMSEDDNRDRVDGREEPKDIEERLQNIVLEKKTLKDNLQASNNAILVEKSQCSHLEKLLKNKTEEVGRLLDQVQEFNKKVDSQESAISNLQSTVEVQKKELCLQEEELTKLQTENIILRNDCDNLVKKEETLSCHLQEKDKELLDQTESETKTQNELKAIAEMLSTIEAEKQELVQTLTNREQSISNLKDQVQTLIQKKDELEKNLEAMEKSLEKESATTREIQETLEEVIQVQEDTAGNQDKFEICKETLQKEHEDKLAFLREQFDMLQAQFISISEEKEKMDGDMMALEKEKTTFESELKELKENSEKEINELAEKTEMLVKERNEIKDKNDTLNAEILELTQLLETAKTENKEALLKWSDSAVADSKTIDEKAVEIKGLHDSLEFFSQENANTKTSLESVSNELADKTSECTSLKSELESLTEQLSAIRFQASTDVMKFEDTLKEHKEQEEIIIRLKVKEQEQEKVVINLETDLETVRRQLEEGRLQQAEELTVANHKLVCCKEELEVTVTKSQELSRLLEQEKSTAANLRHDFEVLRDDKTDREVKLETNITQLTTDNRDLKKRLIKLLREKDTLWQRTEKLDYMLKQKASERWLEDKDVLNCMQCDAEFGLTVRRHHCRLCGRIFCSKCSNHFVMSSSSNKKVRVCELCFIKHEHNKETDGPRSNSISLLVQSDDDDDGEDNTKTYSEQEVYQDNLARSNYSPQNQEQSPTESEIGGSLLTSDQHIQNVPNSPLLQRSPAGTPTKAEGDEFSIISEDEISVIRVIEDDDETQTRTVNEESLVMWDTKTVANIEENSDEFIELDIDAGVGHGIPIMVDEPGVSILWEFKSSPKSVAFAVLFQGMSEGAAIEELIPLCRCNSHREAIQGELTTKQAGTYTLVFDNSFSRFTGKIVKYRLQVKTNEATY
ncbi:FYVE and coiled-coil domain-containing protein 1-like [Antedon mediterranea]|uniref:FYVE and coiled-coil domain-containing protein 1-like n=1 Tax=Antedon mediterranea TaxID=105859 RepID=UPI003AF94244